MAHDPNIALKRAYEPPSAEDGVRVLVERLWPRGVKKEALQLHDWLKDVSPSPELRKWFSHDTSKWDEFARRYKAELEKQTEHVGALVDLCRHQKVTFVYAARDPDHNSALILRDVVLKRLAKDEPG